MAKALKKANIDFYGFQYVKIDKTVSLEYVTEAQAAAGGLTKLRNQNFDERAELIKNGKCVYWLNFTCFYAIWIENTTVIDEVMGLDTEHKNIQNSLKNTVLWKNKTRMCSFY